MKEPSIEEKAKAYDEAKLRMSAAYNSNRCTIGFMNEIFPELKDEDERIRKELLSFFTERAKYTEDSTFNGLSSKEIVTWLEKQAEQKPLNKIKIGKEYKCIASPIYTAFIEGNIYKPEDEFICSLMNFCSDCFEPIEDGEQKPADVRTTGYWNVQDIEQKPADWLQELEDKLANATPEQLAEWKEKYFKVEPAWSEEDEKILNYLLWFYDTCFRWNDTCNDDIKFGDIVTFLKSLRPQSQWKPSDEHYELEEFAKIVRGNLTGISKAVQKLFEAKYLQLTGNKMYGGFKD